MTRDVSSTLEILREEICGSQFCSGVVGSELQQCLLDHCAPAQDYYTSQEKKQTAEQWLRNLMHPADWMTDYNISPVVSKRAQEDISFGAQGQDDDEPSQPQHESMNAAAEGSSPSSSSLQKSCVDKCLSYSGQQLKDCVYWRCTGVGQVVKRWSNRVCMEHRCKEFVESKDRYFKCGRNFCGR